MFKLHEVQPSDARDLERFIRFDWKVYQDNPVWIPPVLQDSRKFLAGKTHFFKYCRYRLWTVENEQGILAKAAAFWDPRFAEYWNKPAGFIGFFEALPDQKEAAALVFKTAEQFLASCGARYAWGPINGNTTSFSGLLMNAFNQPPVFLMPYNPSYYHSYFHQSGYHHQTTLFAFTCDLMNQRLHRKVQFLLRRRSQDPSLTVVPYNPKNPEHDFKKFAAIYADTFSRHWAYTPMTLEELCEILSGLGPLLDPDIFVCAESGGEVVGFCFCIPDYGPAVKEVNGDVSGIQLFKFLRAKKKLTNIKGIAIGVKKSWRSKGIAPLMLAATFEAMIRKGYRSMEYSWVHEANTPSQGIAAAFQGELYKKYAVYEKELQQTGA